MRYKVWLLFCMVLLSPGVAAGAVLGSLQSVLVNHYTFDNPLGGNPLATVELDLGTDVTSIHLINGAPRVADPAWSGSTYSLETGQKNTGPNDDWKAGVMFTSSATSTLIGTNRVTGITLMGWFKPLGDVSSNPSPNTNTEEDPEDYFNAFGLAGLLRGDDDMPGLDGHSVRALLEVINGKVTGLGRRLDDQSGSGQRASVDDWHVVMPPGVWTHLTAAFDFDHGDISLYKNGLPLESFDAQTDAWQVNNNTNRTSNTNAGGIKIAGSYPDNSQERNPFNGRIDELMFFKKFLSAAEVAAQFDLISNLPGDFNGDGNVDAADFTTWRDGLDSVYTMDDYDVWRDHFGASNGSGGIADETTSAAVPEPGISALVILALTCISGRVFLPRRSPV